MKYTGRMILAIMLLLFAAACSSNQVANKPTNDDSAPSTQQSEVADTDTDEAAEETESTQEATNVRIVTGTNGEVEIPADPQRVIGLSVVYPEFLYALGVVPVAVQNYHAEFPAYLSEAFADTLKMGIARTPNFEAILESEPDLILAPQWWAEADYAQLSAIAPTVLLPEREDWRDELIDIARVLGKEDVAEQVIEDLKIQLEQAAAQLDAWLGEETVLYMRVMPKEIVIHGETIARGQFVHQQLGLNPVPSFPQEESALSISLEVLPEYEADHLIVQLDDDSNEEIIRYFDDMLDSSLWQGLKAVQADHVYMVGGKEWFNLGMSPLADRYVAEQIVDLFAERQQR